MLFIWGISILISYLLGSISFSYLFTRWLKGVDIRNYGSGNAGATNTLRVLGTGPAAIVFVLDALKGVASVGIGNWMSHGDHIMMVVCGIAAVVGHNWPVFLRFRGGKGIATTVGVAASCFFGATLISGILAILFIAVTRYVSLGSLVLTIFIPIVMWIMNYSGLMIGLMLIITAMAILRHKQNISNLIHGTERKIHFKGEDA
ncbi:glycerol-3-phosphate 1-O-acyltransferase PlsY [Thermoactinomyces mirandus]|uniref:glycerol-3-phosphate 1-O-acyltransferase PlsY n=1 Tax=Thermoactinomyces mirandus TaxID=2756294 RepID=UPI0028A63DE4|nr:glycerol-3-phosphate 1-O-acyltransferase PlsY [Thermoactinomyces mirandus]